MIDDIFISFSMCSKIGFDLGKEQLVVYGGIYHGYYICKMVVIDKRLFCCAMINLFIHM